MARVSHYYVRLWRLTEPCLGAFFPLDFCAVFVEGIDNEHENVGAWRFCVGCCGLKRWRN